ncbi:outer membrane protein TolC [Lacibacter cauensis]|uniref:Outer membrane protein TolC n=2 Tax=Lacibacter cauensis TaxID=510947 RepID=A0A562SIR4_9BACT|nr:outer membrane protein TolC [Lacibacter cauensis]
MEKENIYQKKKIKMQKLILALLLLATNICFAQNNLSYYTTAAKQNSPLINDNKNQSKANQLDAERLKALYTKPQIGVTANYLFSPIISTDNNKTSFEPNSNGATNYYGYDFAATNGGTYQALLNVTQPLFNGQRYKTASEQLTVTSQINQNNSKLTEHDIEKIVTDQYILCLQDNKQTDYAEAMVKLLEDQKDVLKKLVESSIYKQSDLTLLNIEHQNYLAQLTNFKATYRRDLMDLNILCGINDTALVQLQNTNLTLNSTVSNSMFLEKYHLDSLNLIAQQKAFELKYKPQVSLFANTGLNAVYAPTIPKRFGISAGLTFTYNFFDGNQKSINRNKTQVLEQSVSFYKSNFITQNTVRKSKILTELQSYTDRISIAEQQLKDYKVLLNSYKKEILSGQLSIINYTMVLKNMATAQRDYTLLFSQQQSLINAYNYWNW